jgi:hypothetical protein
MVHYGPKRWAAQLPPPICPKCGSHRTQIVGRSNDLVIVRCSACGERSSVGEEILTKQPAGPGANAL